MIIKSDEDRKGRAERAPRPKFDRFTFTVFFADITEQEYAMRKLTEYNTINPYKYIVVGLELSPNTNRLHLQGYFETTTAVRPRAVMRQLPGFHIEPAIENRDANTKYCTKGNVYFKSEAPISIAEMGVWGSVTPPSLSDLDSEADGLDDNNISAYEALYSDELKRYQAWNEYMKQGNSIAFIPDIVWPEDTLDAMDKYYVDPYDEDEDYTEDDYPQ